MRPRLKITRHLHQRVREALIGLASPEQATNVHEDEYGLVITIVYTR